LGNLYFILLSGDRTSNLEQAIASYQEALRFYMTEETPLRYAETQVSLGLAYFELYNGNQAIHLERAIGCYREALRFHTLEAMPKEHHWTAGALGQIYFVTGHWREAHDVYDMAITAGKTLYQAANSNVTRQAVLQRGATYLVPSDIYCLARLERFQEAVERLEEGMARAMHEVLARNQALGEQTRPVDRIAFEGIRTRIKVLEVEARSWSMVCPEHPSARPFAELSADLVSARQELASIVERIRSYIPEFMPDKITFETIAAAAASSRPLVYLTMTPRSRSEIEPHDFFSRGEAR
jgi:tetratricopeptide (TPR) repeat protein